MTCSIRILKNPISAQNYVVCIAQGQTSKCDRLAQNPIEYLHEVHTYYDTIETNYLACLYLDFQKAFDKVNHAMIIKNKLGALVSQDNV